MNNYGKHKHMEEMYERSGKMRIKDNLVTFLYILMRDCITPGEVEKIMVEHIHFDESNGSYTNGWLAKYAEDIAKRLKEK